MSNRYGATKPHNLSRTSDEDGSRQSPAGSAHERTTTAAEPARSDQVASRETASAQQRRAIEEGVPQVATVKCGEREPGATKVTSNERNVFEDSVREIRAAEIDMIEAGARERYALKRSLLFLRE